MTNSTQNDVEPEKSIKQTLQFFFGITPLFLVTFSPWSSIILILGSFFSLFFLLSKKNKLKNCSDTNIKFKYLIIVTLFAPLFAIAFSSTLRNTYTWADYDSASRFLVAIAIFLFAVRERINILIYFQHAAPTSLILTLLHQIYFPQPKIWGADRMSTYFSDPLVFGYTSLTLGLISLTSINLLEKDSKTLVIFKLIGATIGLYLSIQSGSRTGWLAVPLVMIILLHQRKIFIGNIKILCMWSFGLILAILIGLFESSFTIQQRSDLAFQEIMSYPWIGIAPETSVGLRITFLRIAFDMFTSNPISGFGDTSRGFTSLPVRIYDYASPESLRVAFTAGFHNEIVTNSIRYGIAGLISSAMLFVGPLVIFVYQLRSINHIQRANALVGIVFTVCILISSMSTEVFDLKYTASFYALTISLLCASTIATHEQKSPHFLSAKNSDETNI